jgi:inosine-uridine nucleoside N-ribohydrolase
MSTLGEGFMKFEYDVPDYKKLRVIVDTDAACEADDPFAIAHALLSPKLIVKGIIAEHFKEEGSMEKSYREIETILDVMDMSKEIPIFRGQRGPLSTDDEVSEAVKFIIDEALKDDEKPLYILCQGAITNVAKAITLEPEIKDKITVIWIGTHGEAPCKAPFTEFNATNDISAANIVLKSGIDLWLVPSHVYITVNIGLAEIQRRIRPCGRIGEHLFRNMVDYNMSQFAGWTQGESWSLGDSPAIAIAINPGCGHYHYAKAPLVAEDTSSVVKEDNPQIRIYTDVDSRYILEDFIAKLEIFAFDQNE